MKFAIDMNCKKMQACFLVMFLTFSRLLYYISFHSLHATYLCSAHKKTPPRDGVSCPLDAPEEEKLSLPEWGKHFSFSGSLRPALYSPKRVVPPSIRRPDYANDPGGVSMSEQRDKASHNSIRIYTEKELNGTEEAPGLRHARKMGREVLDVAGKAVRPGVTTDEIDRIVHEACVERDCYPSPLNYYNFPKSVCTSVNEVICQ